MNDTKTVQVNVRVDRVTFTNDTGWTVTRCRFEGRAPADSPVVGRGSFGVVGELGPVRAGDVLFVSGRWEDSKYGLHLKASSAVPMVGATEADLAAFLTQMPDVGAARASAILRALGGRAAVIEALETAPERLTVVPGITEERAKAIAETYRDKRGVGDALAFLTQLELGERTVAKALKHWSGQARRLIEADPYCLIELEGVGFKLADEIARERLGVARDDPRRCRAAARVAIAALEDEGHAWSPLDEATGATDSYLSRKIRTALELSPDELAHGMRLATQPWRDALGHVHDPLVVLRSGDAKADEHLCGPTLRVWSATTDLAEQGLAEHLVRLVAGVRGAQAQTSLELPLDLWQDCTPAQEQVAAVEAIAKHRVLVITGGPGCGKTRTVLEVLKTLEHNGVATACCAPTGKAAVRMEEQTGRVATTIHRLLAYHPGMGGFRHDDGEAEIDDSGKWIRGGPIDFGAVVVDESSMVDTGLFHALVRAIPDGARLIVVGDVDQLPSIGPGRCLHDLIESGIVPVCRLSRIFRQASESRIPYVARDINAGLAPDFTATDGDVQFIEEDDPERLANVMVRAVAQVLPTANAARGRRGFDPLSEIQVLTPQRTGPAGREALNRALQAALNPAREGGEGVWIGGGDQARRRDRVIHTKNNYQLVVFNGEMGSVVAIDSRGLTAGDLAEAARERGTKPETTSGASGPSSRRTPKVLVVDFGDRVVAYSREDAKQLLLGYAITIHKSQGSQFPCIVLPVHAQHQFMLSRSLTYTGITRASELAVVFGQPAAMARAVVNARGTERRTTLQERLHFEMTGERTTGERTASERTASEQDLTGQVWTDRLPAHDDGRASAELER